MINIDSSNKKILFIGCGKMGGAIIKNLLSNGFEYNQFIILKPSKSNMITGIKYISSYDQLPKSYQADIVVFGFKPQVAREILMDFAIHKPFSSNTIFTSILAGKKTSFFEEILGEKAKVVRIMPNLPTLINEGIFGYYLNHNINKLEAESLTQFLNGVGKNIALEKEELINKVTAISGSGPAYLFLFAQYMIESAIELGIDKELAKQLVSQTIYGSAKMVLNSDDDAVDLIKSVASKGGTTQAALDVLQKNGDFKEIISNSTKAAHKRSIDLSQQDLK
ncbi:MAG: pyrroline-5-carboxylate reductase [Lentimonas sp.]|jgi:pyrroline-5-carboxylate reductase